MVKYFLATLSQTLGLLAIRKKKKFCRSKIKGFSVDVGTELESALLDSNCSKDSSNIPDK